MAKHLSSALKCLFEIIYINLESKEGEFMNHGETHLLSLLKDRHVSFSGFVILLIDLSRVSK